MKERKRIKERKKKENDDTPWSCSGLEAQQCIAMQRSAVQCNVVQCSAV
jgi:hypothetical protein